MKKASVRTQNKKQSRVSAAVVVETPKVVAEQATPLQTANRLAAKYKKLYEKMSAWKQQADAVQAELLEFCESHPELFDGYTLNLDVMKVKQVKQVDYSFPAGFDYNKFLKQHPNALKLQLKKSAVTDDVLENWGIQTNEGKRKLVTEW